MDRRPDARPRVRREPPQGDPPRGRRRPRGPRRGERLTPLAPIHLGCCPDRPRCVICPPPPEPPTPEYVAALAENYEQTEPRTASGGHAPCRVGFFGGPPPSDALLAAAGDRPKLVRVRPDLLTRTEATRLRDRGVESIELDALSFDDRVLKDARRRYRGAVVEEMLKGIRDMGLSPGITLWPGLPGSSFESCLADARRAAPFVDTARLHPTLVLEGADLQRWHIDGQYKPLELGEAITVCRAMMDVLEAAAVQVIRVGLQAGPDGYGKALAGPRHPALRELIETRRTLEVLVERVAGTPAGAHVVIRCAPADETRTRGPLNQHVRDLRARFSLREVEIRPDPDLARGVWVIDRGEGTT